MSDDRNQKSAQSQCEEAPRNPDHPRSTRSVSGAGCVRQHSEDHLDSRSPWLRAIDAAGSGNIGTGWIRNNAKHAKHA